MDLRFAPGIKLMSHRQFVDYFDNLTIYPIGVEISPSGRCNSNCPDCLYRQKNNKLAGLDSKLFDDDRMFKLMEEFVVLGVSSITWTGGGDPSMHPSFPLFVKYANGLGIKQGLFTNGLLPIRYDPSLLEWIRVTYTDQPINEAVLMSMRSCKTLGLCINYAPRHNEELVYELLAIAERLDAAKTSPSHSTYLQVRPVLQIEGESVVNSSPKITHPLLNITDYKFRGLGDGRNYQVCEAFHFVPFVWQDGTVDICAYHRKEPAYRLGNLHDEGKKGTFKYIMDNAPAKIAVAPNCQTVCKLHEMNSIIQLRKDLSDKDISFP